MQNIIDEFGDGGTSLTRQKIPVTELQLGMYISELDRPWLGTPFLFQGFLINHADEIEQLQTYCEYVYIDVTQTIVREQKTLKSGKVKTVTTKKTQQIYKISTESELPAAIQHYDKAKNQVDDVLASLRLGNDIDAAKVIAVVKGCIESMLRNPNALIWLTQIKHKDDYTAEHCLRVAILAIALGRELNLLEGELETLGVCGMLHDVGKVKIPNDVLNKEGALTKQEFDLIKTHSAHGRKLLMAHSNVPHIAIDVAYSHHERITGGGYPRGISGEKIPYFAKLVSIVDAYDAITSDRVYSKGRSTLEALRILYEERDKQFDKEAVEAFVRLMGIYPPGHIAELTSGEVGIIISCPPNNKLSPKVLVVLNSEKMLTSEKILDLQKDLKDHHGRPYRVKAIHPNGAYGIDLEEYRKKGLVLNAS